MFTYNPDAAEFDQVAGWIHIDNKNGPYLYSWRTDGIGNTGNYLDLIIKAESRESFVNTFSFGVGSAEYGSLEEAKIGQKDAIAVVKFIYTGDYLEGVEIVHRY